MTHSRVLQLSAELAQLPRGERFAALLAMARELPMAGDLAGDVLQQLDTRRHATGNFYTPAPLVELVGTLAADALAGRPVRRVLDPATGTGRFLLDAAQRFAEAELIGVDLSNQALALARVNLERRGLNAELLHGDALARETLAGIGPADLVIGNPPYGRATPSLYVRTVLVPFAFASRWFTEQARPAPYDPARVGRVPKHEQNRGKLADLVAWFLGLGMHHTAPGGVLALLTSSAWLTIPTWRYVRRYLL